MGKVGSEREKFILNYPYLLKGEDERGGKKKDRKRSRWEEGSLEGMGKRTKYQGTCMEKGKTICVEILFYTCILQ